MTLLTTGPMPSIEPASVTFLVDDARLELRGRRLQGSRLVFRTTTGVHGEDVCVGPQPDGAGERCSFSLAPGIAAAPTALSLAIWPAGVHGASDETLFDAEGRRASAGEQKIEISRVIVSSLLRASASLDAALGGGALALEHPEAVLGADCAPASCSVESGAVVVAMVPPAQSTLTVRLLLAPRAHRAVKTQGMDAMSFTALESQMLHWFDDDGPASTGACVAYVDTGSAWVVAAGPLCAPCDPPGVADRFVRAAKAVGRRASFFGTERTTVPGFAQLGGWQRGTSLARR